MTTKRETPEAIEEPSTGSTNYSRFSSRATGKRKVIGVLILVSYALMATILTFSQAKLGEGAHIWGGFWVAAIFIGVWLIAAIVRVLRKGP